MPMILNSAPPDSVHRRVRVGARAVAGLVLWLAGACGAFAADQAAATAAQEGHQAAVREAQRGSGMATQSSASQNVPASTSSPAVTGQYTNAGSVTNAGAAKVSSCRSGSTSDECEAVRNADTSARAPRTALTESDRAAIRNKDAIAKNPSGQIGATSMASFYDGCQVSTSSTAASTQIQSCLVRSAGANQTCSRRLVIESGHSTSCEPGKWDTVAQMTARWGPAAQTSTSVGALCMPASTGLTSPMRFKGITAVAETPVVEVNMAGAPVTFPVTLGTAGGKVFFYAGNRCGVGGDATLCEAQWYIAPEAKEVCGWTGSGEDTTWTCTTPPPYFDPAAGGYSINPAWRSQIVGAKTTFVAPHWTGTALNEQWVDDCSAFRSATASQTCTIAGPEYCAEGPATRQIGMESVTRACWRFDSPLSCESAAPNTEQCDALVSAGCTLSTTACVRKNLITGECLDEQRNFRCPVDAGATDRVSNCATGTYCVGANCFDTTREVDPDFTRTISLLESQRQQTKYLDPNTMTVFNGTAGSCRKRALTNCCSSDSRGNLLTNAALNPGSSAYVFDALSPGDPLSKAIADAIKNLPNPNPFMVSCNEDEKKAALKEGAKLCHTVGEYCSSRLPLIGCVERTTGKCCFNSILSKQINIQGRAQLGRAWGTPEKPECKGFTIAEMTRLDLGTMDFSEFYASIRYTPFDNGAAGAATSTKLETCAYGDPRC